MPKIYLYAEILTHIRQLTLYASIQTKKDEGTKLDVSSDRKVITVKHDDETQQLYLPTQISGNAQVVFPLLKQTEISARLEIDDEHEWKNKVNPEIQAPWNASVLSLESRLSCKVCQSQILRPYQVGIWKDLPNENWADLMDLWFCHKPHDEEADSEEAAAAKGFATKSKLTVAQGIGMTNLSSIVLHRSDCTNTQIAESQQRPDLIVIRCATCSAILGTTEGDQEAVKLNKPSLAVTLSQDSQSYESFSSNVFICAQILSLVEATSVKKIVIYSKTGQQSPGMLQAIVLWIFNPDIYYSCSAYGSQAINNKHVGADETETMCDIPAQQARAVETSIEGNIQTTNRKVFTRSNRQGATTDTQDTPVTPNLVSSITIESDLSFVPARSNPTTHVNLVHRATKVFYKPFSTVAILGQSLDEFLDDNTKSHESLCILDPQDIVSLRAELDKSNAMLPSSAQSFQDWKIGLLERWEELPSGVHVMAENPLVHGIKVKDVKEHAEKVGASVNMQDDASQL